MEIREFVLTHAVWILKTLQRLESRAAEKPPAPQYKNGEMHPYLEQMYPLDVSTGHKASATVLSGRICITTKGEPTAEKVRKLLDRWYRAQAEIIFHERLGACRGKMPGGSPCPP
jgi:predicted metal-dependent hydrolase